MKKVSKTTREVQSVKRALMILDCFDQRRTELSLQMICEELEMNKSTVYGILNTLLKYGYIDKNPKNGRYLLGQALAGKSALVANQPSEKLHRTALKYMKLLTNKYDVTSYLFSYRNSLLTCVEMLLPHNTYYSAVSSILGRKMVYHAAATGKVVLAHLNHLELETYLKKASLIRFTEHTLTEPALVYEDVLRTRRQGYSIEYDEIDQGVGAFAFPIYNMDGSLIGTLSISGTTEQVSEHKESILQDLKDYSRLISTQLCESTAE